MTGPRRQANTLFFRVTDLLALAAMAALAPAPAWAWPPTYGTEYNFGDDAIRRAWLARGEAAKNQGRWQDPKEAEQNAATKFADAVKAKCGADCTVTPHTGKFGSTEYSVHFTDGYEFNVSVDPDCVEIQTRPETLEQLRRNEQKAQSYIFDVAQSAGLNGIGKIAHFNIGILSAFDDAREFMSFFVNYHNHPQLASGVLGLDFPNAPPISHLEPSQRAALARLVTDVNEGRVWRVQDAVRRLKTEVYTATPTYKEGPVHYQGVSVKYVDDGTTASHDAPMELRATRQPATARERTLLAELFEKRIAYEKSLNTPIAFIDVGRRTEYTVKDNANAFRLYLAEMGADYDHFKDLLPAELRNTVADVFLTGKVNWDRAKDIKTVESYVKYAPTSPWVRDRLKQMMADPNAISSGATKRLIGAAKKALGENANFEAKAAVAEIFDLPKPVRPPPTPEEVAARAVSPWDSPRGYGDRTGVRGPSHEPSPQPRTAEPGLAGTCTNAVKSLLKRLFLRFH